MGITAALPVEGQPIREGDALDACMHRHADGDRAAFRELHRLLAPRMRAFLVRLSGGAANADDLVQETFLRMHRARGSFERGAAVLPWAYAIARNVFLDHARSAKTRPRTSTLEAIPADAHPQTDEASLADAELTAKRMLHVVRETLAALPEAQREAFILVRFEGLSVADAALVLDTSESNVKVRVFRAAEAFRQALALKEVDRP